MPKRVLIADDSELYRGLLTDILKAAGHDVVGAATDGREAYIMASRLKPDVVILDIVMPGMNGLEAAREISALEDSPKIIMCSSLGFEDTIENAISAGACGYISKPFDRETVLGAVAKALGEIRTTDGA